MSIHVWTVVQKLVIYGLNGLAIMLLWQWSVVEVFHLRELHICHSIVFGILLRLPNDRYIPRNKTDQLNNALYTLYNPLLAIIIGYLVHETIRWMP